MFKIFNCFWHLWLIISLCRGRDKLFSWCLGIFLCRFCSYNFSRCLFLKYRIELSLDICKPKLLFNFRVFNLLSFLFLLLNLFLFFIRLMQILKKLHILSLIITLIFFHVNVEFFLCDICVRFCILIDNVFGWLLCFVMSGWIVRGQVVLWLVSLTVCHVILWCCLWVLISGCILGGALESLLII